MPVERTNIWMKDCCMLLILVPLGPIASAPSRSLEINHPKNVGEESYVWKCKKKNGNVVFLVQKNEMIPKSTWQQQSLHKALALRSLSQGHKTSINLERGMVRDCVNSDSNGILCSFNLLTRQTITINVDIYLREAGEMLDTKIETTIQRLHLKCADHSMNVFKLWPRSCLKNQSRTITVKLKKLQTLESLAADD